MHFTFSKFGVASKSVRGLLKLAVDTLNCYNDVNMLLPLWSVGFFTINPLKNVFLFLCPKCLFCVSISKILTDVNIRGTLILLQLEAVKCKFSQLRDQFKSQEAPTWIPERVWIQVWYGMMTAIFEIVGHKLESFTFFPFVIPNFQYVLPKP